MEFRAKARLTLSLILLAALATAGEPFKLEVRHRHLRGGGPGTLTFDDEGLRFEESGKKAGHSRSWKYADLQQLELAGDRIRVRTYEDVRWQGGRDREYVFDEIPDGAAATLYALLAPRLDERFIAEVPSSAGTPLWEAPAKRLRATGGFNGTLKIGTDRIVFESAAGRGSRTWRYSDIQNFSSAGGYELSVTSLDGETRFQLKQPLPEARYNALWRRITEANGLLPFQPPKETRND